MHATFHLPEGSESRPAGDTVEANAFRVADHRARTRS